MKPDVYHEAENIGNAPGGENRRDDRNRKEKQSALGHDKSSGKLSCTRQSCWIWRCTAFVTFDRDFNLGCYINRHYGVGTPYGVFTRDTQDH